MQTASGGKNVIYLIYLGHGLSAWGDRMWEFAVGLYMIILFPDSLMHTAILGLAIALVAILFGSAIGSWIDHNTRIKSAVLAIVIQNAAVISGATGLVLMIVFSDDIKNTWNGGLEIAVYSLIVLISVIANLGAVASDIAIERDWIVVLAEGNEKSLTTMNAVMRMIDLTTKILAPLAVGSLISLWSPITGAVFIITWNVISAFVEVYILFLIYKKVPKLGCKEIPQYSSESILRQCWIGWSTYIKHPIKWAGIGFSCVYMSVLGLDQITIGYMYNQGVDESLIGIIIALAAIAGIIGSILYPSLRHRMGPNATFMLGYFLNSIFLLVCIISVFLPGSPFDPGAIANIFAIENELDDATSGSPEHETFSIEELWEQRRNIFCFVTGIIFARIGLWITDLSMTQLLQDKVEQTKRGEVNAVQNSINQIMDMLKFFIVILLPSPKTFGYLIILSWTFACLGWALYCIYSVRSRKDGKYSLINDESLEEFGADECTVTNNALADEQTPLLVPK